MNHLLAPPLIFEAKALLKEAKLTWTNIYYNSVKQKLQWDVLFKPGFDVEDLSEDGPDDLEGLDASAAHVAYLLSTEPADSMFLLQLMSGYHWSNAFFKS